MARCAMMLKEKEASRRRNVSSSSQRDSFSIDERAGRRLTTRWELEWAWKSSELFQVGTTRAPVLAFSEEGVWRSWGRAMGERWRFGRRRYIAEHWWQVDGYTVVPMIVSKGERVSRTWLMKRRMRLMGRRGGRKRKGGRRGSSSARERWRMLSDSLDGREMHIV